MTDEQILTKLVEQAVEGGFKLISLFPDKTRDNINIFGWSIVDNKLIINYHLKDQAYKKHYFITVSFPDLWTNHDFMNAVLGDWCETNNKKCSPVDGKSCDVYCGGYDDERHIIIITEIASLPTLDEQLAYVEKNILEVE